MGQISKKHAKTVTNLPNTEPKLKLYERESQIDNLQYPSKIGVKKAKLQRNTLIQSKETR
jgi:hypothetical protein